MKIISGLSFIECIIVSCRYKKWFVIKNDDEKTQQISRISRQVYKLSSKFIKNLGYFKMRHSYDVVFVHDSRHIVSDTIDIICEEKEERRVKFTSHRYKTSSFLYISHTSRRITRHDKCEL